MQKHKILSFLLALLAAIVLWVYAVTVVNPDDKVSIRGVPVRIVGTSELQMSQLILTGGEFQYVDVEIAGRRSDLKELNNTTLMAVADASKIDGPGTYELSWTLDPPSTVASGDIKLVSSSANKIKVKISELAERRQIPVRLEYSGALAEGYVRDPAVMNYAAVPVSGPVEEVDTIRFARAVIDLGDTKSSLDMNLEYELIGEDGEPLSLSSYTTLHEPEIHVTVPVYCYKQIKLELDIVPGGGAEIGNAEYTIDPPVIGVTGDEVALRAMPATLSIKTVKLAEVKDTLTAVVTPELPEGVTIRGQGETVQIKLTLRGLTTRTFYVGSDTIIRINDNETLDFAMDRIPITVRGQTEVIRSFSLGKLYLTADMTEGFDPETMTVKLEVSFAEGVSCGVTEKYSIPVTERPEETEPDETTRDR
ncbi:MAG: hypothetical protein IKM59_02330 [Oscillospiraceae bacterium]|nr:hypothetical protein [Oscillospiraceae bacterium]